MDIMRRFAQRLRRKPVMDPLTEQLERAQRACLLERYDEAIISLDEAMAIAQARGDSTAETDINLRRGDILIGQERYTEAQTWLTDMRDAHEGTQHITPLAYVLCALGQIEQARSNLDAARAHYESARETAKSIETDGALGRATAHLGDVYLQEGNASYALYLLQDALPRLEASGDRELLAYFMGRLGEALIATGQRQAGLREMQRGLETAIGLQHRAHIRLLSAALGHQAQNSGDFRLARHYYEDAVALYPENRTPDLRLMIALSQTLTALDQATEAMDFAEKALAAAVKLADDNLSAEARVALAQALLVIGDSAAAQTQLNAVEATVEALPNTTQFEWLQAKAASESDSRQAENYYRQALQVSDVQPLQRAIIDEKLARLNEQASDSEVSKQHWLAARDGFVESQQMGRAALVDCALGTHYAKRCDGRSAKRAYGDALATLSQVSDTVIRGEVLGYVATAYSHYGPIESALEFFTESIEIGRRSQNIHAEAHRRAQYGYLLALTNQPKQAITELMQARNQSHEHNFALLAASCTDYLGLAYAVLDNLEKAASLHREAIGNLEQLDESTHMVLALTHLADVEHQWGQQRAATENYQNALQLATEHQHYIAQIRGQVGLARYADFEDAQRRLQLAEKIAQAAQYKRELALVYTVQSQRYAQASDPTASKQAWTKAVKLRETMQMPTVDPTWL